MGTKLSYDTQNDHIKNIKNGGQEFLKLLEVNTQYN